ncbi:hypothetical protein N7497_004793 [Penicillium chrysogenum]|nr:hypothetical protein N7497_004793 [Penicillium chrysogenum]
MLMRLLRLSAILGSRVT